MREFSCSSHEIEEVAQLENQLAAHLDYPDESQTIMEYITPVGSHHSLDVQVSSQTEDWLGAPAGYSHRMFLFHEQPPIQPASDPANIPKIAAHQCSREVVFSLLYEHSEDDEDDYVHGVSKQVPPEVLFAKCKSPEELAMLALTNQFAGKSDFWLSESDWRQYNLDVPTFITQTGRLAARGAHIETVCISRTTIDDLSLWATRHTINGDERHVTPSLRNQPHLKFEIIEDGLEYVFERMPGKHAEVKIRIEDELIRYAGLPSLEVEYDEEDGTPLCWSYDPREIAALEAEDRARGLYVPTKENMQLFLQHVAVLAPESS